MAEKIATNMTTEGQTFCRCPSSFYTKIRNVETIEKKITLEEKKERKWENVLTEVPINNHPF